MKYSLVCAALCVALAGVSAVALSNTAARAEALDQEFALQPNAPTKVCTLFEIGIIRQLVEYATDESGRE